jgi:hypothetical protein
VRLVCDSSPLSIDDWCLAITEAEASESNRAASYQVCEGRQGDVRIATFLDRIQSGVHRR